jgi:hypothetical protein
LLRGEKSAFKLKEVNFVKIPLWPELGVKKLVEMVKDDVKVCKYLPDKFFDKKFPS